MAAKAVAILKARNLVSNWQFDPDTYSALGRPETQALRVRRPWLTRVADPEVARRRRDNYQHLLDELAEFVPVPFDTLPDGASPYTFPITVARKAEVLQRLRALGVHAVNIWSMPHPSCPSGRFQRTVERRATTVGLPVHQELRRADLDSIVRAVRGTLDGIEVPTGVE